MLYGTRKQSMKRSDIVTISLLFFVVLPALCVYFELYQSVYYVVYSTVCRYWYHLRWKGEGRLYVDDYSVQLLKELVTENAARVKDAEIVMKNLDSMKQTVDGAWMNEDKGWTQQSDSNRTDSTGLNKDVTDEKISKIHVALAIVSCRRETVYDDGLSFKPRYLIQNVASLAPLLSERGKNIATAQVIFSLSICSVSEGDLTAEEYFLSHLFTVIRFHPIGGTTFGPNHDVMAWAYEKEKRDYVHCLRHSASIKEVDYVVLVEDDAIARPEALDVVEKLVLRRRKHINNLHNKIKQSKNNRITNYMDFNKTNDERYILNSDGNYDVVSKREIKPDSNLVLDENCYYVKLYHPPRLLGYLSWECERIPQLLAIAAVLGTVLHWFSIRQKKSNVSILTYRPTVKGNEYYSVTSGGFFRKCESLSIFYWLGLFGYCRTFCCGIYASSYHFLYGLFPCNLLTSTMNISHYRWLRICLICGLAALLVGRPHMDDAWRRLISPHLHYTVPDVHCCTQSVLYSRQAALQLSNYLHRVRCNDTWHKDDAIWAWAQGGSIDVMASEDWAASAQNDYLLKPNELDSGGLNDDDFRDLMNVRTKKDIGVKIVPVDGHLIQPNIFKHIGLWSSLRKGFIDPRLIRE